MRAAHELKYRRIEKSESAKTTDLGRRDGEESSRMDYERRMRLTNMTISENWRTHSTDMFRKLVI